MAVFCPFKRFKIRPMMTYRKLLFLSLKSLFVAVCFVPLLNCSYLPQRDTVVNKVDIPGTAPSLNGQSDIVFVRTSLVASAVVAHLYKISNEVPEYVATMPNNTKFEYPLSPGRHTFMIVSADSVDFVRVDASAQRTYYSLVEPHMGVWKPSFSIKPVKLNGVDVVINSGDFNESAEGASYAEEVKTKLDGAKWIVASDQTPPEIDGSIDTRYREAWNEWLKKSTKEQDAKTLNAIDGVIERS